MDKPRLVFLISLPRSGSTLLQKILASHPDIYSVTEPWLLLPFGYLQQPWGLMAPYDHDWATRALDDFIETLPGRREQFYSAIKDFVVTLYQHSINKRQVVYFLDKTPRYYLILPFLTEVFPDAKYIFLFRNPLAVFASILTTWLNNELRIYRYYPDLYCGPSLLTEGYRQMKPKAIALRYSELVSDPATTVRRVCDYLTIRYDSNMLTEYRTVEFDGQYGDETGISEYDTITTASLEKWKTVLNTGYRKWLARRYVRDISDRILVQFGTSAAELLREIDSISQVRSGSIQDIYNHFISNVKRWLFVEYFKYQLKPSTRKYRFHR